MTSASDIFDSVHYERVRLSHLEAATLPSWCYTSEEFFQREVERIFTRTWNFVGREDEVPNPGDYFTLAMFGESVIVVRDDSGHVRAFVNTCRHRGTRLLDGKGHCRNIICPYHAWTYALNGTLIGMSGMEKTLAFEKSENGLLPVRLESWAGFMFVNFSQTTQSLLVHLGDLPHKFASYNFANMICVRRKEYDLRCNWKLYLENAMEDYHTPMVHKTSIGLQETTREETTGQWDAIHMESDSTIAVLPEDNSPFPHIPGLRGHPATGTYFTAVYPSTFFGTTQDCMWWLQQLVQGPDHTKVIVGSCFPRDTVARSDFEHEVHKYYRRWDKSIP